MPCGPSVSGGLAGGGQNGPVESGGGGEQQPGPATPQSTPSTGAVGGSTSSAIATISTDPAAPSGLASFSPRPPLPPPPRATHCVHGRALGTTGNAVDSTAENGSLNNGDSNRSDRSRPWWRSWNRKYVLLCGLCGFSSVLLGAFYLVIYFVLRSYTSSLQFFQTMPTYVPACVLMVTGFCVLCFMRRKNRIAVLIKVVGFLCLVCAVVCVVVTVTTTVLHMNRLQTLSECTFYTRLHSCTCHPFTEEEPFELKLDSRITTCDVIHGPLYSCLRAMFGVSVIGILVSIFSCMLVYQMLSHEKKKMYWEQLENRRRFLYRRSALPSANSCSCCDEYGFVPPSELYPWRMWDSVDERYWSGGPQLYSPTGEESSTASRSVLLGGNANTPHGGGTPSLWLPWGGAWGAPNAAQPHGTTRDVATPVESIVSPMEPEIITSEDTRPQTTGVLLRPFLPRGLEARFGLRRQPPPLPNHGSRRPLSDPGVALQLTRFPPPFSEAFLPPLPYDGLEALSRLVWDPPPPYSQPSAQDSRATRSPAPTTDPSRALSPITRHPSAHPSAAGMPSPTHVVDSPTSPAHLSPLKDDPGLLGDTGSLPLDPRLRRLPLGHVKSLGDVTDVTRDSLEALLRGSKKPPHVDKFEPHGDVTQRLLALKARHLKAGSDPRAVYLKTEQESELYFADVSSCVSLRQEDDKDDVLYYSEPAGPTDDLEDERAASPGTHLYEQVRHHGDGEEEEEEEEDVASHHTSDDTMIVHTSSSDHSLGLDTENAYSVASPSSASPMATDTDAYSCYQAPPALPHRGEPQPSNLNLHPHHFHHPPTSHAPPQETLTQLTAPRFNDNERLSAGDAQAPDEPCYEAIPVEEGTPLAPSDLNGNVALSTGTHEPSVVRQAQRTPLTLPLRRALPSTRGEGETGTPPDTGVVSPQMRSRRVKAGSHDRGGFSPSGETNPSSPPGRRLHSIPDHLLALKSVNV